MYPGLSNAVSMIIFWFLVMKIQSDEVPSFLVIFDDFLVLCSKKMKMNKNDRKCCNFIRFNFHNQKSKSYHRHGIWKPRIHTFQKYNFGQHLVNNCWLKYHSKTHYIVFWLISLQFPRIDRSTLVDQVLTKIIFLKIMYPGLSNAVSMIIFWFFVMKIQSDEVTAFSAIFINFHILLESPKKSSKMMELHQIEFP